MEGHSDISVSVDHQPDKSSIGLNTFAALPVIALLLSPDKNHFQILAATDDYVSTSQRSRDQLIGRDLFGVFPHLTDQSENDGAFQLRKSLNRVIDTREAQYLPMHRYDAEFNGRVEERYWSSVNKPVFDKNGAIESIIHSVEDITGKVKSARRREGVQFLEQAYNLFLQAPVAILIVKGPELILEFANEPSLSIWRKGKEVVGMRLVDVLPELAEQGLIDVLNSVMASGKTFQAFEAPVILMRDGKEDVGYFNFVYHPLYESGHEQAEGVMIFASEVTEHVNAKRALIESEERFRLMADQVPQFIWLTGKENGAVTYCNQTMLDFTGLSSPENLKAENWKTIVHCDDVESIARIYRSAFSSLQSFTLECRFRHAATGEYHWFLLHSVPRHGIEGDFLGYIGTGVDITEGKQASEKLKESAEQFRNLLEALPQITWTSFPDGEMNFYNQQWYKFTGLSENEIRASGWKKILHPQDLQLTFNAYASALESGNNFVMENRWRRSDGVYRWHLNSAIPVKNEKGETVLWVGSATDIHEQKGIEERLEELVKERTAQLERSNEDLQQFAHVASHDLKEPVRKVKFFANRLETVVKDRLNAEEVSYLVKIQSAADRMNSMINGVLAYSMMNTFEQSNEPVNLNEIIKNIQCDLEVLMKEKQAAIRMEKFPTVNGAPDLLYQLFYNLINNSLKFSIEKLPVIIDISCQVRQSANVNYVELTLKDNGIGFDQLQAERIFEPFARLNPKDRYEGTGLGLSLCKKIVERHNGTISAMSQKGSGSTFLISLPLYGTH